MTPQNELRLTQNVQRVGFLALIPALLRRFGVDPAEILAAAGLGSAALDNPESTIPYRAMGNVATLCAEKSGCPHFGLELGARVRTTSLGIVGELMRSAPTLGIALMDFTSHQHRHAHGGVAYLLTNKHEAFFGYAVYQPNVPGNNLICDGAALAAFNLVRELADTPGADGQGTVVEVLFARSEPEDLTHWRRLFGVKLRFDADQTAVVLHRSSLDKPLASADAVLRGILEKRVQSLWYAGELDTLTRLSRMLRIAVLSGRISANEIAAQLGMSRRTLHRRLEDQGFRFQELVDQTRGEFARQLLTNTALSVGKIGMIVGYSDPSVFTRAFVRWAGSTPSEWRAKLQS